MIGNPRTLAVGVDVKSNGGVPLRHIQSISFHKTLSALERYLDVSDEQKFQAISQLSF